MPEKFKYKDENVEFSNIKNTNIRIGQKISRSGYTEDENGNIVNMPVINAIDIDWNNAKINNVNKTISTTADLLNVISDIKQNSGNGGGDGNSIPIYDAETENRLNEEGSLPEKYISLGDDYNLPNNATLISNLFSVISDLQAEVNKLKNTFTRGIYSYNGEATFMSNVVSQYGDDEEPLWAIDERELEEITNLNFNIETSKTFIDTNLILHDNEDQRMFLYCTCDSSDINVTLINIQDASDKLIFNFSDYIDCGKCNIMLIVSRLPQDKSYPANYVYFTITDYEANTTIAQGYLNNNCELVDTQFNLNGRYYIYEVDMSTANPSKFNIYTDDKILGNEVIPATPEEDEDSYRVAHIAIRSCKNYTTIQKISKQLAKNELIFDEDKEILYINAKGKLIKIGAATSGDDSGGDNPPIDPGWDDEDTTMTNQEILKALAEQGIISIKFKETFEDDEQQYASSNIETYNLNDIGSVRFIHEETGKIFEFKTNANGELESKLIEDTSTFESQLNDLGKTLNADFISERGFIGNFNDFMNNRSDSAADRKLDADRIRIGAIYAPLATDVIHGCSHAYVELENTSDHDYNLSGCGLHYIHYDENLGYYVKHTLKLTGIIKAGSTYLIRGKKYIINDNDPNCFIHVNTYDQEWYTNNELIDFSIDDNVSSPKKSSVFVLTYLNTPKHSALYLLNNEIDYNTIIGRNYLGDLTSSNPGTLTICNTSLKPSYDANASYTLAAGLIDATIIGVSRYGLGINKGWPMALKSNCIYKNTFELDPAKQAFNGFASKDSSRVRWASLANDAQYLILNKEYIEFPKSNSIKPVSDYTPKASFENKNVCTDKTKFNKEKPNAVTVSLGEDIYTTRCFNWLSGSNENEYVWVYEENGNLVGKFESYKTRDLTAKTKVTEIDLNDSISELENCSKNAKYSYENNKWIFKDYTSININLSDDASDNSTWVVKYVSDTSEELQGWYKYKKIKSNLITSLLNYPSYATYTYNDENDTWEFSYTDIDGERVSTIIEKSNFTTKKNDEIIFIYDNLADLKFEYVNRTWKTYVIEGYEQITENNINNVPSNASISINGRNCTFTYISNTFELNIADAQLKFKFDQNIGKWCSYHEQSVTTYTDDIYQQYLHPTDNQGTEINPTYPRRKEFPYNVNNIIYCDYRPHTTLDRSRTDKNGNYLDVSYSKYSKASRACGLFAATNDFYVSHKCIIQFSKPTETSKKIYYYVVGQSDKNGNPLQDHCSERRSFTIYSNDCTPRIYQITDQQGFHWVEYQVWEAAAMKLNDKINQDLIDNPNILPIIINTGDATQSGSRVNEWLDYFIGGDSLFNHYEQNNIVGNNDLNGTDVQFLGTGDDDGKSNGYYYYLFNCVDANNFFGGEEDPHYPIVNNVYVPSLYYLDSDNIRIVLANSEITSVNCRDWFNLNYNGYTVNIYTGYSLNETLGNEEYVADKTVENNATYNKFTPIYTLMWHAFNDSDKKCMVACHEMPFTVITHKCIAENAAQIQRYRSLSDASTAALIGCHMNQITSKELGAGIYWFSRLLESSGVKLCIGGHKHTYAITYPLRENYKYTIEYNKSTGQYINVDAKSSLIDGPMSMGPTLENEKGNVSWIWKPNAQYINLANTEDKIKGDWRKAEYPWFGTQINGNLYTENINWSKFPITYRGTNFIEYNDNDLKSLFYPCIPKYNFDSNNEYYLEDDKYDAYSDRAVRYIMCQATGYKLKSNKELPTPRQKFSNIIPKTNPGTSSDTPSNNQLYPMFATYDFDITNANNVQTIKCKVKMGRITNIFNAKYKFDQSTYDTKLGINNMKIEYLIDKTRYTDDMLNDINFILEYDGGPSAADLKNTVKVYDNYGLWYKKEAQMLDDIIL